MPIEVHVDQAGQDSSRSRFNLPSAVQCRAPTNNTSNSRTTAHPLPHPTRTTVVAPQERAATRPPPRRGRPQATVQPFGVIFDHPWCRRAFTSAAWSRSTR